METVDNAIENTDAIIGKRLKQGLMQDLLTRGIIENYELGIMNDELGVVSHESEIGNWELRDERKHKFKDSPLGRIPEEWEVVKLGDKIYLNPDKVIYEKNKLISYIDIESVNDETIQTVKVFEIEEAPSRAQRIVKANDVIVSTVRPSLRAFAFITPKYDNYVCSTGFAVFRATRTSLIRYSYFI